MLRKKPLMPKSTAAWLLEHSSLSFRQIAKFCELHELEVKAMADQTNGIVGIDPIQNGQLSKEQIEKCSKNPDLDLILEKNYEVTISKRAKRAQGRYTPIARRQDKPSAILWLLNNFPKIDDVSIIKLIGTTKKTIESIKQKTHWNIDNIQEKDPVVLGLCEQGAIKALENKEMNKKNEHNNVG